MIRLLNISEFNSLIHREITTTNFNEVVATWELCSCKQLHLYIQARHVLEYVGLDRWTSYSETMRVVYMAILYTWGKEQTELGRIRREHEQAINYCVELKEQVQTLEQENANLEVIAKNHRAIFDILLEEQDHTLSSAQQVRSILVMSGAKGGPKELPERGQETNPEDIQ